MEDKACKVCGGGPLVDSHIYPRSFYWQSGKPGTPLGIIGSNGSLKKSFKGITEKMLCGRCERVFSEPDRHAINFVRNFESTCSPRYSEGVQVGWSFSKRDVAVEQILKFAQSVLLRAHLTSAPFFSKVRLGPHYSPLCDAVMRSEAGWSADYPVILTRTPEVYGQIVGSPAKARIMGRNGWLMRLSGMGFFVVVDKLGIPACFDGFVLKPGRDGFVMNLPVTEEYAGQLSRLTASISGKLDRLFGIDK